MSSAYHRNLQRIANEFFAATGEAGSTKEIVRWGIDQGMLETTTELAERRLAEDMASAMRDEHRRDPQGREVRAKHAARVRRNGRSEFVWDDTNHASRKHMEISLMQRRNGIVGDCRGLKVDVDSYNQNRCPDNPIQMHFDFTKDLAELEGAEQLTGGPSAA